MNELKNRIFQSVKYKMVAPLCVQNLETLTLQNTYYRHVIYTLPHFQFVLMSIPPCRSIGMEVHPDTTQFIRVEGGSGVAIVSGHVYALQDGSSITIPPNTPHDIQNTSSVDDLKLYTIYNQQEHPAGVIEVADLF